MDVTAHRLAFEFVAGTSFCCVSHALIGFCAFCELISALQWQTSRQGPALAERSCCMTKSSKMLLTAILLTSVLLAACASTVESHAPQHRGVPPVSQGPLAPPARTCAGAHCIVPAHASTSAYPLLLASALITAAPVQRGVDYEPLRQALREQDFYKADDIHRKKLIEVAGSGAQDRGWVYFSEVRPPGSSCPSALAAGQNVGQCLLCACMACTCMMLSMHDVDTLRAPLLSCCSTLQLC